jgi:hypothetical protein
LVAQRLANGSSYVAGAALNSFDSGMERVILTLPSAASSGTRTVS